MNAKKWLKSSDPGAMLDVLKGKVSGRKLRLFAVACCRPLVPKRHYYQDGLDIAEEVADAAKPSRKLLRSLEEYCDMAMEAGDPIGWAMQFTLDIDLPTRGLDSEFTGWVAGLREDVSEDDELVRFADHLRDIFGNPFRPVAVDPAWLTSTAVALAKGIYEKKAFDRLPYLADALQDAGCENADVLEHCRGEGTHVRGCWVVDLVLGKS